MTKSTTTTRIAKTGALSRKTPVPESKSASTVIDLQVA